MQSCTLPWAVFFAQPCTEVPSTLIIIIPCSTIATLWFGSDTGGETLARAMTLIESAKMSGLDPQAYLADLLDRIHDHKANRLDELLPWNWKPQVQQQQAA